MLIARKKTISYQAPCYPPRFKRQIFLIGRKTITLVIRIKLVTAQYFILFKTFYYNLIKIEKSFPKCKITFSISVLHQTSKIPNQKYFDRSVHSVRGNNKSITPPQGTMYAVSRSCCTVARYGYLKLNKIPCHLHVLSSLSSPHLMKGQFQKQMCYGEATYGHASKTWLRHMNCNRIPKDLLQSEIDS